MASHEDTIRLAAARLHDAIVAGRRDGLTVTWPARAEDLSSIAISETGRVKVDVTVASDVDPAVAAKAAGAAQKAADMVVDKA